MKILKIFGVVVGIHVFALILIFANPGCSSANKGSPSAADTVVKNDTAPSAESDATSPISVAPAGAGAIAFDPNAPAATVRFSPTRPGTPAAAVIEAQPVGDVIPMTTYTVKSGDSLWSIAKKNHTTVAEIAAANTMKVSDAVRVGKKLMIPGKSMQGNSVAAAPAAERPAAAPRPAAARPSGDPVKHVVKAGETLGGIARKYQVKIGEIEVANNITDPAKIRPGMELTIPGWQAPASKSSKTAAAKPAVETAPPAAVKTVIVPPPEQDLDAGLDAKNTQPPVIKVEEK